MSWTMETDNNLHVGDIIVIVCYFAFVLFVGLWSSRQNRGTAGGYFLAGRSMNWIPMGASLFASNIGSLHFVGLAGSGAASGIAIALYEFNAMFVVLGLGYIFLPVYISSGVFTMPEYLKRRFGGRRIQMYLAVLALLVYIFTKISADLYAGALFIEQAIGWDIYPAIMLLLAIAAIFTITGGLTAVLWTDLIQTVIMLVGAFVLMIISFEKVGGIEGLFEKYPHSIATGRALLNITNDDDDNIITTTAATYDHNDNDHSTSSSIWGVTVVMENVTGGGGSRRECGRPRDDYDHLFRDPLSGDLPWPGLLGIVINSTWYWCADQVIVQRSLAGKTYDHSKMGCVLCGYLKLLPFFLLVLPGMVARVLFTETVGCWDPEVCMEVCGSRSGCSNIAYPIMVLNLLPAGARGIMMAVMMSALMSSLTSIFNSSSTIFAMDVWTHIRRRASELEVMIVGRLFVVLLVVISIIWVPVLKASQGSQLFVYIQEVSSFLQPPICAVFLLALFWPRFSEKGAFVALVVGMAVGMVRFGIQYSYTVPECGSGLPDPTPSIVKDVHYLYFSALLFALTLLVAAGVTVFTTPVNPRCIERLTWWSRHSTKPCWDIDQWSRDPEAYTVKMDAAKQTDSAHSLPCDPLQPDHTDLDHKPCAQPEDVSFLQNSREEGDVNVNMMTAAEDSEVKVNTMPGVGDGEVKVKTMLVAEDGEIKVKLMTTAAGDQEERGAKLTGDGGDVGNEKEMENSQTTLSPVIIEEDHEHTVKGGGGSVLTRALRWVCGVDSISRTSHVASHVVHHQDMVSIRQHPRWKLASNLLSGVLVLAATAMLIVYA